MSGDQDEPDVGGVAEEAVKLLGALSDWAKDATRVGTPGGVGDLGAHFATGAPECTVCPICRTVHAVRGLSPEVKAHLATAATSLLHAAAGLLATAVPDERARGGVEHIDLDDVTEWPEEPAAEEPEEER